MPTTNGHQVNVGLVLDGHYGWHNHARMIGEARELGFPLDDEALAIVFRYDSGDSDPESDDFEIVHDIMDEAERWLNDNTPPECTECGGAMYATSDGFYHHRDYANGRTPCGVAATDTARHYLWHWSDGEFFLSPMCEDDDCDDDTCAHWSFQ